MFRSKPGPPASPRPGKIAVAAFASVYVIWGSTYLAIRTAVETLPPWGLSASRYAIAGLAMLAIARLRRESKLSPEQRRIAWGSGPLLVSANGFVCLAEKSVPSGVAAVLVGAMPIWTMVIGWAAFRQAAPTARKIAGACVGLAGVGLIAASDAAAPLAGDSRLGVIFLLGSSWLWVCGTLMQRGLSGLRSAFRFSGIQMLAGALATAALSLALERPWEFSIATVSLASAAAFAYLVLFGSIVAFTAYAWLSRNVEPHLVSTYALVNPLIAVGLGAWIYHEPVGPRFLGAAALVGLGLWLLVWAKKPVGSAESA